MKEELTVEDCIKSFERVEPISEIIVLGIEGGIRRIQINDEDPDPDIDDEDDEDDGDDNDYDDDDDDDWEDLENGDKDEF
jgi:hypothetical protein